MGIYDVSFGFRHFPAIQQQPAVSVNLFRKRQVQRHQERRPDNRVKPHDFFADKMHLGRPVFPVQAVVPASIAQSRNIVGQGVHPYVYDVLFVKGDGNAPVKRRSGYAQIFQPGTQEIVQHFVLAGNGLYKIRMAFNMLDQPFLIFRETKEIAFLLLCMLHRSAAVRAFSAIQLRFSPKASHGVQYQPSYSLL